MTPNQEKRILDMRVGGWSFEAIAAELHLESADVAYKAFVEVLERSFRAVKSVADEKQELVDLIVKIQWSGNEAGTACPASPSCGYRDGHDEQCAIGIALRKAGVSR